MARAQVASGAVVRCGLINARKGMKIVRESIEIALIVEQSCTESCNLNSCQLKLQDRNGEQNVLYKSLTD